MGRHGDVGSGGSHTHPPRVLATASIASSIAEPVQEAWNLKLDEWKMDPESGPEKTRERRGLLLEGRIRI